MAHAAPGLIFDYGIVEVVRGQGLEVFIEDNGSLSIFVIGRKHQIVEICLFAFTAGVDSHTDIAHCSCARCVSERVHKSKAVLEAERQAKDAIARNQLENERLENQKERMAGEVQDMKKQKVRLEEQNDKLEGEIHNKEQHKEKLEGNISQLEDYAAALDIKEEDLIVPTLKTDPLVKDAWDAIKTELEKPIPAFGQKEWREERRKAIKVILTEMQTALMQAKELQKQDILKLGKALYNKAMQNVRAIIEQNKQLQKENGRLTEENDVLRKRIASMDENAITRLRDKKDAEIKELQERLGKAESEAVRSDNVVSRERQRADKAEGQIKEMLGIPEIKEIWESIQQKKRNFNRQLNQWIDNALKAIAHFAAYEKNVHFSEQQSSAISMGIFAKAFKSGLDVTDNTARLKATQSLLDEVDWSEASNYKQGLTRHWTEMFSLDMPISQAIIETLTLAAGGRGGISIGGGGSSSELTNWDGTKKKTGWGM